jgi:transcriptional regulator with XRE-family HTH domain
MALSALGRKHLLGFGRQREIARKLGLSESYVSMVVSGVVVPRTEKGRKTARRVQVAVARALGMKLHEAFAELAPQSVQESAGRYVATTT